MRRNSTAAIALAVGVGMALASCGEAADSPGPARSATAESPPSFSVTVPPSSPAPASAPPTTPEGEIDKLAATNGWVVDALYPSVSAFVRDMCESLPVSAIDGESRPQWLAGHLKGDGQAVLKAGIPKLCPTWTKTLEEAVSGDYEVWLSNGDYEVSSEQQPGEKSVKPGTYRIKGDLENCYWERLTRSGEIIDNNFASAAREITVTVRASDGLFRSEGCEGAWKPVR
ncbi:hypothetical protein ACFV0H_35200 [Streptomyces erythrochromogenes]|uniref:hypothetical protein n=1 Tax=Streptomyces erythrochromogenes TaxID=285574 RepID=UPI00367A4FB7